MFCFNLRQGGLIYMDAFNLSSPHSIWDPRLLDYAEGGPNDPRTTFNDLRKWLTAVKEESKWSTNPECLFWSKELLELVHNFLERDTRSCHRGGGKLMMLSFVSACRQNTFALNPTSICSFGGELIALHYVGLIGGGKEAVCHERITRQWSGAQGLSESW